MPDSMLSIGDSTVPRFMYGTAWKEERTQELTELALRQGFRGIDTANQRRHYYEAAVGAAIAESIKLGVVSRNDLFLQTKFTYRDAQDERLPYDPGASIAKQVEQSFASSLEHLGTDKIDSYLLHGPAMRFGLAPADWAAWQAMEEIHDRGLVRFLGISNIDHERLRILCERTRVRPTFVQNRCRLSQGWDRSVRQFCKANGLIYQGFSLLTANWDSLKRPELVQIAKRHGRGLAQIIFRFALDIGIIPLTGTSNADHMKADLEALDFQLQPDEIEYIENLLPQ
jgi:diketogulonate reductase-like aldo/keto reductase